MKIDRNFKDKTAVKKIKQIAVDFAYFVHFLTYYIQKKEGDMICTEKTKLQRGSCYSLLCFH